MKKLIITLAVTLGGLVAPAMLMAGPLGLPDHEPNGFRDTGCDAEAQVAITNDKGEILYWNNATCPDIDSGKMTFTPVASVPEDDCPDA